MIIECSYCESRVDGQVLASHEEFDPENDPCPYNVSLLECPSCNNSLVGIQEGMEVVGKGIRWGKAMRVWPRPKRYISWSVPKIIRTSLEEADPCINAGAYTGAVAMCGRALEGICRHYKTENPYLGGGIKELFEKGVIDKRIYSWSEELRKHRNIAVHAEDQHITKEDATDLQDFVSAITEYIFVLTEKFAKFTARQKKAGAKKKATLKKIGHA